LEQFAYLPVTWASSISVEPHAEGLVVTGRLPLLDSDIEKGGDPYFRYLTSVKSQFGQKQTGKDSPHIRFANALDVDSLTAFVREFGPVVPSEVSIHEPPDHEQMLLEEQARTDWHSTVTAVQPLPTLRKEQRTYAAALRLMIELKRGKNKSSASAILQHVTAIADGVCYWPEQCESERVWRQEQLFEPPTWHFDAGDRDRFSGWKYDAEWWVRFEQTPAPQRDDYPDSDGYLRAYVHHVFHPRPRAHDVGHAVLCKLVNTFRTEVFNYQDDHPVEALPLLSLRFGIRPALYVILKKEYLGRGGAMICGNDRCAEFFVSERAGQRYCCTDCSQQYRQRDYWVRIGAKKRKRRRAKLRSKTKAENQRLREAENPRSRRRLRQQ
jgi:hypothetical protein